MTELGVTDLHSHIVPGVDDGARSFQEACDILRRIQADCGAGSTVVLTPHFSTAMPVRVASARREKGLKFLEMKGGEFDLELHLAGELMVQGLGMDNVECARYPGTGWVLVEFRPGELWIQAKLLVRRLIRSGYRPMIAHPERYSWCRRREDRLMELSQMGCGTMVSARSFRIQKYAAAARRLLSRGLVHCIASDAHTRSDRILDGQMKELVADSVRVPWETLTEQMPGLVLEDEPLPCLPLIQGDG